MSDHARKLQMLGVPGFFSCNELEILDIKNESSCWIIDFRYSRANLQVAVWIVKHYHFFSPSDSLCKKDKIKKLKQAFHSTDRIKSILEKHLFYRLSLLVYINAFLKVLFWQIYILLIIYLIKFCYFVIRLRSEFKL